jgi:hypothetical protein
MTTWTRTILEGSGGLILMFNGDVMLRKLEKPREYIDAVRDAYYIT